MGPSIASGSQMCSGNCALLPIAPAIRPSPKRVITDWPIIIPLMISISAPLLISAMLSVPVESQIRIIAASIPRSPSRVTRNAFFAAAAAEGLWNQKPIRK